MDSMEKVYHELTGVDLEVQRRLWDERGKGYYGEFLVFRELYADIPGACKILMNLQIPTANGKTTEIDLLMIHETGLYVFEIKHYKGTIYGKAAEAHWTQYFRTSPNQSFNNPVNQNQYHINALKRFFPDLPIYSFVVFTSRECDLRIEGTFPNTTICALYEMLRAFSSVCRQKACVLDVSRIDELFLRLKQFSPMMETAVATDGVVMPFYRYLDLLKANFQEELSQNEKRVKRYKSRMIGVFSLIVVLMLLISLSYGQQCKDSVNAAQQDLAAFAQKFEHVDTSDLSDLEILYAPVFVSDVVLEDSSDISNAVDFSCLLKWHEGDLGVSIGKDAAFIVILKDGSVKQFYLWNDVYPYSFDYCIGKWNLLSGSTEGKVPSHTFYGVQLSDISYIKLSNLGVFRHMDSKFEPLMHGYEIELYSCSDNA